ncbi:MAG TPA: NAD(P)H-dependent oxidoreductase [Steroidobacteraceae bacterium]|nr:NAD(P)H-dependent oxidoreductase [Steroidobacteraceae bacterium]
MKHLIVVAHPSASSFTMALTRLYATELERLGHTQHTSDLYRMGFNPVLRAEELASTGYPPSHAVPADVAQAQRQVRDADVLTVFYPLWWLSMPAIMKGYIDRVFARGFAYEATHGVVRGLLTGKQCVLITLSGAPLTELAQDGRWSAVEALQDTQVFRSAGFELLEHLHLDQVQPNLSVAAAEHHFARILGCVRRHFSSENSKQ